MMKGHGGPRNHTHSGPQNLSSGDWYTTPCNDCGEQFKVIVGVEQDPPRSSSFCPECYLDQQRVSGSLVAGKWSIGEGELRDVITNAVEKETDYEVYIAERVNDMYIYDPEETDD